jgi:FtsP/CotA-like multicopper oxidase with cupredoxin domain
MQDMGHGSEHSGMDHSQMNHETMPEMDHSKMSHEAMPAMDHSQMNHETMPAMDHSKMNHAAMAGMDHSKMNHETMSEMDHTQMGHAQHNTTASSVQEAVTPVYGWANASTPKGDKALQYSDLKSLEPQKDTREATSELVIRLGGTMERYLWTINGKKFSDAEPLKVKYGERIRIKFVNDSMMAHPMHLHGMFMQLENGQAAVDMPNKHTLIVPPGKTVTALLTADELGEWAIHCHLLYHMSSGMMNKLIVANVSDSQVSTTPIQEQKTAAQAEPKGDEHAHH